MKGMCGSRAGRVSRHQRMTMKVSVGEWVEEIRPEAFGVVGQRGCRGSRSRFMQRALTGAWTVGTRPGCCCRVAVYVGIMLRAEEKRWKVGSLGDDITWGV